ncbi:MAG TPA: gliding motility-associated C-terminal domain-containing protein, partial [Saprospiraceae bacterium]|nr:gliding motility-associated C-terminal domain-containing protein [Saprospiraceae bacterium]
IDGVYEWSYSFNGSPFTVATGTNEQRDYTTTTLGVGEHRFQRKYTTTSGIICDDLSNIITINVYPNPTATITGDNEICAGENSIFTANGGATYLWNTTETSASITVDLALEYIVTVTDANGCTATASRTLKVYPLPIASITGDNEICAGENTIFTVNGGVTYLWDTNETTSFITVSVAREYIVTVTDVNGCTATASRTLTVNPLPIASITGDNEICAGENTIFTANGGATYLWNTTETSTSITVNEAIEYIVTVTDVYGCTATASRTLTITPLPNAGADVSVTCYETGVAVMSASGVGIWTLGTSAGTAVITNPNSATTTITNFSINGTYELIWTVGACSDTVLVTVGDDCDCPIINNIINTPTPSSYCETASNITIIGEEASPIDGVYEWSYSFNGSTFAVATGTNDQRDYTTTTLGIGEHRFQRKYTTISGIICEDLSNIVTINVNPLPIAIITGDSEICAGENSIFTANGGATYLWDTNETSSFITVSVAREYVVTVTDVNGCTATASRTLTVNPLPIASITGDNEICAGENSIFTANGGVTYLWDTNETSSFITVSVAREYIVTVTDVNGCTATASRTLTITPLPNAGADVSVTCYETGVAVMSASGVGTWTLGTSAGTAIITNPNSATTTITNFSINGTYELIWTVGSCSDTVLVTVGDDCDCAIVNNIILPINGQFCNEVSNVNITASVASPAGGDYQWEYSFNAGPFTPIALSNVSDLTTQVLGVGNHRFRRIYTISGPIACSDTSNIVALRVNSNPTASITGDNEICTGESTIFTANGGASYLWSTTETSASITVDLALEYIVTVTDVNGCTATASRTLTVNPLPIASITGNNTICSGESSIFTVNGGATYLWDTNETTSFISVSVAREYIVTVTDVNGCTATASRTLTVTPLPNAGADVSVTCYETGVAVMSASGVGTWTLGTSAGTAIITNPNSATTTITNFSINGTYELIWTVGACSDTVLVTVGDDCNCAIVNNIILPINGQFCNEVSNVNITASVASPAGGDYQWEYSFNAGPFTPIALSNVTDLTTQVLGVGNHRFRRIYTIAGPIACSDTSNIVALRVNPNPTASITGDNDICFGGSTVFTANGGSSYLWSNGEATPSITITDADTYSVIVTDANGCTGSASIDLTVGNSLTVSITGDNDICFGTSTVFTASGGASFLWSNGETTPSITITDADTYSVIVTDANGCTGSASRDLTVGNSMTVSITGDNDICFGTSTVFTASSGASYLWSNGETTPSIIITDADTYSVIVTDANGCTGSASRELTVGNSLTVSITGNNNICFGTNTIFTANGGASYIWSNGKTSAAITVSVSNDYTVTVTDANGCTASASRVLTVGQEVNAAIMGNNNICFGTSTLFTASGGSSYLWNTGAVTPSITVTDTDTYSVVVTDANGCTASASRVLSVGQEVNARISGNTKICQGATSIFTASGGSSYLWNTDETTNSITVAENGLYSVSVYDAAGCYDVASLSLEVTDRLDAPFDVVADKDPICLGDTVTLTVSGIDGAVFNWSSSSASSGLQNGLSAESIVIPTAPGTYTYTITQKFEACQLESLPIEITLVVNDLPRFNIGSDTTICELDGGIMLSVDGFDNVVWSDGTERENMFIRSKGKYSVEVTDDHGCMSSDEITIKNFCCRIYHPNIISLSSTSGNDQFSMTETSCVITSKLSIYDRWGNMVYRSDNGLEPWDGTYKGQPVEIGVYAFIFTYTALDEDDNLFEDAVKGDVTVIR